MTSDAEIITLAVVNALLGYTSETRWIRHLRTDTDLRAMFPRVPGKSGYNKRVHSLTATVGSGGGCTTRGRGVLCLVLGLVRMCVVMRWRVWWLVSRPRRWGGFWGTGVGR